MTLAKMVYALPNEKLLELQSVIVDAGISNEFKGDHQALFRRRRQTATGKQKKLYAALSRASRDEMRRISDIIINQPTKRLNP